MPKTPLISENPAPSAPSLCRADCRPGVWGRQALRESFVLTGRAAHSAFARHGRAHYGLSGRCQFEVDLRYRLL
jgi:hypothetical protein